KQDDALFLMERAKRIDFEFFLEIDGSSREEVLHFTPRRDGRDARSLTVYRFEWGVNLTSFTPRLSTTGQFSEVTVRGWDPRTKQPIVYTARASDLPACAAGGRSGTAKADSKARKFIYDAPVLSLEEARRLATSLLMERANVYTKGSG